MNHVFALKNSILKSKLWKLIFADDGSFRFWTAPVVLLGVIFLSYGLYIKHFGFYWDDWNFAWVRYFQGLEGFKVSSGLSRPLRAYFEAGLTPILGVDPVAWQIYGMLTRWLAAVALWWSLRQIWTKSSRLVFTAALLFAIYPGFSQQSMAMTYHYFWFFQAVLYLSFGLMVLAVRTPGYFWPGMISAVILSALQLFSSEYLVGLELLRPFIFWIVLASIAPGFKQRFGRSVLYTLPFLLVLGIYLYWRIFVLKFPTYQLTLPGQIRSAPLQSLFDLAGMIWHSFGVVTVRAWENTLQVALQGFIYRVSMIYPALVILGAIGLIIYQNRLQAHPSSTPSPAIHKRREAWQFIGFGLLAILLAGIPFYISGLAVQAQFEADRFSLPYILGVSLFIVGLLELLPNSWQSITLGAVLAALAIGLQFYHSAIYRDEARLQKTFAWQLAWRIPGLKPDTVILADNDRFRFMDDEALAYLINWTYAPDNTSNQLPVSYNLLSKRLGDTIPAIQAGQPVRQSYYLSEFTGSTDQALVIYFNPPSCLRVLNPAYDQGLIYLQINRFVNGRVAILDAFAQPPLASAALPLSNMDQILPAPAYAARPPSFLFDPEPSTNWCYFFEKADLARQTGDWEKVVSLGDEAFGDGYGPVDLSEYLIFIEGYARLGRLDDAARLTSRISETAPVLDPALCAIWERARMTGQLSESDEEQIASIKQHLMCNSAR